MNERINNAAGTDSSNEVFDDLNNIEINAVDFQAPNGEVARQSFRLTPSHFLLFALALLALAFIAFITLARSIEVRAIKVDLNNLEKYFAQAAQIDIGSAIKLPLGNRVLLLPGKHPVRIAAEGFSTVDQSLEVGSDRHQQFEIELVRLPGKLDIKIGNEGGGELVADVLVDGVSAGSLPGLIENIAAGKHQVVVDAPLYRPVSQPVLVKGKNETQTLSLILQPAWAEYQFSSTPEAASVVLDGEVVGKTPLSLKIEEGAHQLQIRADKFKPYTQEIGVVAGEDLSIPNIELIPADGELTLSSTPVGAAVILNNEFRGITPLQLQLAPNTQQQVKIYKAGFRLSEQTLELEPEQVVDKQVSLSADIIPVRISVSPQDANVYVDGALRGKGSQTLNLNTLPHKISVRKTGYVTQNSDIIPSRRNKQIVSVSLLTEEQHYWAQVPDTYSNRFGHKMKLFKQLGPQRGSVKMGSSRREDGRRANEAVYKATLTKPFYVALHETTNKQFRAFKGSHNSGNYKGKSLDAQKAPVANISWQDAARYCNWLSKQEGLDPFYITTKGFVSGSVKSANGYRLLTEVEWAWLARNKDGNSLTYPWGNTKAIPGNKRVGNFADKKAADILAFTLSDYDDGYKGPAPVGRFGANHHGLFDMGGNASEWVNDWYSSKGNSELKGSGALTDPLGPDVGEFHVVRGASWAKGHLPQLRLAYRDYAAKGKHDVGFRIARYAGLNKGK